MKSRNAGIPCITQFNSPKHNSINILCIDCWCIRSLMTYHSNYHWQGENDLLNINYQEFICYTQPKDFKITLYSSLASASKQKRRKCTKGAQVKSWSGILCRAHPHNGPSILPCSVSPARSKTQWARPLNFVQKLWNSELKTIVLKL